MRLILIATLLLVGCASPDVEKSTSRDRTMSDVARIALINEMLNSPDPAVRLEGARIAREFLSPKKSLFDF